MKQQNFKTKRLCSKTFKALINEANRPVHAQKIVHDLQKEHNREAAFPNLKFEKHFVSKQNIM